MMTRAASKRAKMASNSRHNVSAKLPPFIPFHTGPRLERIPDDVFLEIVSHLPTIGHYLHPALISHLMYDSASIPARTPTLRVLSKTSRLLRSRCLALAWQRFEFWGTDLWKHDISFDKAIGKTNVAGIRFLKACSHLLPFVRTVSIILTMHQKAVIIPEFAARLATLPNLDTIEVIYAESRIQPVIKNAFRGKRFPSVRRITLPSSMREIVKVCPNLEEVTSVEGDGSQIIQSLVEGKCHQVRILKGISASLTRLVDLVPNLTHVSVVLESDMTPLINFPFLDTIEILIDYDIKMDLPFSEFEALNINRAKEILLRNKSQAPKTVVLTRSKSYWDHRVNEFDIGRPCTAREIIKIRASIGDSKNVDFVALLAPLFNSSSKSKMITRAAAKAKRAEITSPDSDSVSAEPLPFIPFQTRPSLERIPEDVLLEIVSHLPTLGHPKDASLKSPRLEYVVPSTILVRTSTLRALSKTSRLLRSRCLPMAWQNVELCGEKLRYKLAYYDAFGAATEIAIRVLDACPYLLPFVQTVSVILTRYRYTEIIPDFAACLATLPNLSAVHVVHTEYRLKTAIRNAFRGIRLPSVRRISLSSLSHDIIRSCPNVEEVVCLEDDYEGGSRIIQSLAECKCYHVRIVKGISAPLTQLINIAPNLTHASVSMKSDMTSLTDFPHLDTIEILVQYLYSQERQPLSEIAASDIEKAREILKGNKSQAEKTVVLRRLNSSRCYGAYEFAVGETRLTREIIKV